MEAKIREQDREEGKTDIEKQLSRETSTQVFQRNLMMRMAGIMAMKKWMSRAKR